MKDMIVRGEDELSDIAKQLRRRGTYHLLKLEVGLVS